MADLVTARVPAEIRRQGNILLKQIGSTPTELVNAAYRYVIEEGRLPRGSTAVYDGRLCAPDGGVAVRRLSPEQARRLAVSIERTTVDVADSSWGDDASSYKGIIARGRAADYEALS